MAKKKIADIAKDIREKMQNGGGTNRRELMQEGRTKVEAILTADQKAAIEKYNKEHPRGQGRGQRPPRAERRPAPLEAARSRMVFRSRLHLARKPRPGARTHRARS